ncbi:hypothetical protein MSG28_014570, partial [Choristoneura fumiferana]
MEEHDFVGCISCMNTNDLYNLFATYTDNVETYAKMFETCFELKVLDVSRYICASCAQKLEEAYVLKEQTLKNIAMLQSIKEFMLFKSAIQEETKYRFRKTTASKQTIEGIRSHYMCSQSGVYVCQGKGKRPAPERQIYKTGKACPAHMIVTETTEGVLELEIMEKHDVDTAWICDSCGMGFMDSAKFRDHVATHGLALYPCQYCSNVTYNMVNSFNEVFVATTEAVCPVVPQFQPRDGATDVVTERQAFPNTTALPGQATVIAAARRTDTPFLPPGSSRTRTAYSGADLDIKYCKQVALSYEILPHRDSAPLSTSVKALKDEKVKVTFVLHDGKRIESEAKVGDTLLDVIVNNDLNIEGYGLETVVKPKIIEKQVDVIDEISVASAKASKDDAAPEETKLIDASSVDSNVFLDTNIKIGLDSEMSLPVSENSSLDERLVYSDVEIPEIEDEELLDELDAQISQVDPNFDEKVLEDETVTIKTHVEPENIIEESDDTVPQQTLGSEMDVDEIKDEKSDPNDDTFTSTNDLETSSYEINNEHKLTNPDVMLEIPTQELIETFDDSDMSDAALEYDEDVLLNNDVADNDTVLIE